MSGGFFRGTSADQDTRFSNKQAKLLKSQKFAPELEHLVDMTKVKMDVIRPWIATRVTELLGFEDEVLINFIYGLLDGKEVNGKEVQISLTGFMEKNTGKFMKELWTLLLSAQRNASGVPQQFLDAKEEEARMKKAESDRIANEIQKKKDKDKESRELEQERVRKMDDGDERKAGDAELDHSSKNMLPKGSSVCHEEERDADQRNGLGRKRVSRSPCSTGRPPSPRRSLSRSVSRSFSNSRSYSDGKGKSRSVSRSPQPRRRSISFDKTYRSPRRSPTPRSRYSPRSSRSPARQSSSYSRRRSRSHSPRRSPSPVRRRLRSPYRYRSPSPVRRRRSPSPVRRRRSPSPVRRRRSPSPVRRHRSPSPVRRRRSPSPVRRRRSPSPVRRRRSPSPRHRRSPSPARRHRSPVSMRHRRSPSLVRHHRSPLDVHRISRSPVRRKSPSPTHRRSPSPLRHRSPSLVRNRRRRSSSTPRHRSPSPARRGSPGSRRRSITPSHGKSPSPYQSSSASPVQHRSSPVRRFRKDQRSPLLSPGERQRMSGKLSPVSVSPSHLRKQSTSEDRRSSSLHGSPMRQGRERIARDDSFSPERKLRESKGQQDSKGSGSKNGASRSRHSPPAGKQRVSPRKVHTPERLTSSRSTESRKDLEMKSEKSSGKGVHLGTPDRQRSPALSQDSFQGEKQSASHLGAGKRSDEKSRSRQNNMKDGDKHHKAETSPMSLEKLDHNNNGLDSGSEGSDKHRTKHKERRKHKRSERREVTSDEDSSSDSEIEDRKEAKRRRKEEKRSRKEEKRRRREERRRRREERRAEKLKMKGEDNYDDDAAARRKSDPGFDEEAETEQKKLEIELRNRALESLKAKKGISG
ncbi:hypothetical protein V6N12_046837 [Hibiscus sabdariffa]|uniref:PWI domain-containing protein n=1 Tax=Hibiscus sabdariffa TaxID=183260 RepID=A0ABR1ZZX0_9ROSI